MGLKLITAPSILPVTVAEAKLHLRVDHSEEDDLIERAISSATGFVDGPDGFLGRALIDQTWELTLDEFPINEIRIPLPPLIEVVSVIYDDADGNPQTIATSDYSVDNVSEPGWVLPLSSGSWPTVFEGINSVRIRFRAGYVDMSQSPVVGEVPAEIINAILLHVGDQYANRENIVLGVSAVEMKTSEHLLRRRRRDISLA